MAQQSALVTKVCALLSTRIKAAGIAIRHSQGYIISILQGPEISTNMHPKNVLYAGNLILGRREAFGTGPEPQNGSKACKNFENDGFGLLGPLLEVSSYWGGHTSSQL